MRYKLRFPEGALEDALRVGMRALPTQPVAINRKRSYMSVEAPTVASALSFRGIRKRASGDRAWADLRYFDTSLEVLRVEYGIEVVEEVQYTPDITEPEWWPFSGRDEAKLSRVLRAINASPVETLANNGAGAVIAVVDTGINASKAGIAPERRGFGFSAGSTGSAWADAAGHGTRSARIAAGQLGIARGATVYPCRTEFYEGELPVIYDHLVDDLLPTLGDRRLVISNSFGFRSGSPPPSNDPEFIDAITDAVTAGAIVVFSAGNYHQLAGGAKDACSPTSIWSYKCSTRVITVGAAALNGGMQPYSSRGPGQLTGAPGMSRKPDVCAPVPRRWTTSGACPQVAGLAALLVSAKPDLTPDQVRAAISRAAQPMGKGYDCEGAGVIDCRRALAGV